MSVTDVDGLSVGHWTDPVARTGCTVVLFPEGTVASGEVRGGAPATREFALLEPQRLVQRIDALMPHLKSAWFVGGIPTTGTHGSRLIDDTRTTLGVEAIRLVSARGSSDHTPYLATLAIPAKEKPPVANGIYPDAVRKLITPGANDPAIKPRVAILHVDAGNSFSLFATSAMRSAASRALVVPRSCAMATTSIPVPITSTTVPTASSASVRTSRVIRRPVPMSPRMAVTTACPVRARALPYRSLTLDRTSAAVNSACSAAR